MAVWLFLNPQKSLIENKFREVWTHFYLSSFIRFILMSDFNSKPHETVMSYFMELHIFKKIVKLPTCFKNPEKPSCIDFFSPTDQVIFKATGSLKQAYLIFEN